MCVRVQKAKVGVVGGSCMLKIMPCIQNNSYCRQSTGVVKQAGRGGCGRKCVVGHAGQRSWDKETYTRDMGTRSFSAAAHIQAET